MAKRHVRIMKRHFRHYYATKLLFLGAFFIAHVEPKPGMAMRGENAPSSLREVLKCRAAYLRSPRIEVSGIRCFAASSRLAPISTLWPRWWGCAAPHLAAGPKCNARRASRRHLFEIVVAAIIFGRHLRFPASLTHCQHASGCGFAPMISSSPHRRLCERGACERWQRDMILNSKYACCAIACRTGTSWKELRAAGCAGR